MAVPPNVPKSTLPDAAEKNCVRQPIRLAIAISRHLPGSIDGIGNTIDASADAPEGHIPGRSRAAEASGLRGEEAVIGKADHHAGVIDRVTYACRYTRIAKVAQRNVGGSRIENGFHTTAAGRLPKSDDLAGIVDTARFAHGDIPAPHVEIDVIGAGAAEEHGMNDGEIGVGKPNHLAEIIQRVRLARPAAERAKVRE